MKKVLSMALLLVSVYSVQAYFENVVSNVASTVDSAVAPIGRTFFCRRVE